MSHDPYRPNAPPPPDPELLRLAQQGHQRRMEIAAQHQARQHVEGSRHLNTAVGGYRGSTLRRTVLGFLLGSGGFGTIGFVLGPFVGGPAAGALALFGVLGMTTAFGLFFAYVFMPPIASASAIAAESQWAQSRPFALVGYFEVLAAEPTAGCVVVFDVAWAPGTRPPDHGLVQGVVAAIDPQARVIDVDAGGMQLMSGAISGHTGIRVNRQTLYRNHRLAGPIHRLIDEALATMHRSYPIAGVSLRRG